MGRECFAVIPGRGHPGMNYCGEACVCSAPLDIESKENEFQPKRWSRNPGVETDLSSPAKRESRAVSSFQPRKLHQLLPILAPKPLLGCSGEPQVIFVKWSTTLNSKDCIYLRCTTRQKQNTPALSGQALPSCFSYFFCGASPSQSELPGFIGFAQTPGWISLLSFLSSFNFGRGKRHSVDNTERYQIMTGYIIIYLFLKNTSTLVFVSGLLRKTKSRRLPQLQFQFWSACVGSLAPSELRFPLKQNER